MEHENTIICRCSDVTLAEIRKLISEGYTTFDEIKRITRVGMGACQGKTCMNLVLREISIMTGTPLKELRQQTMRPPVVGVRLELIAREAARNAK